MNFNIKTPCANCPFRNDIPSYLSKERVHDIYTEISEKDNTFYCHKTILNKKIPKKNASHCAGALILLEKEQKLKNNYLLRLAQMAGLLSIQNLDLTAPVFNTIDEMIFAQKV